MSNSNNDSCLGALHCFYFVVVLGALMQIHNLRGALAARNIFINFWNQVNHLKVAGIETVARLK